MGPANVPAQLTTIGASNNPRLESTPITFPPLTRIPVTLQSYINTQPHAFAFAMNELVVNTGSVTNRATATNGTVTSNEATATVNQVAAIGQIAPTATTCQDF
jgi:hypothetical protein